MASTILKLSKELFVALSGFFIGGVRLLEEYSLGLDIGPRGIFFFGHFMRLGKR